jgi:hypothetical protein
MLLALGRKPAMAARQIATEIDDMQTKLGQISNRFIAGLRVNGQTQFP